MEAESSGFTGGSQGTSYGGRPLTSLGGRMTGDLSAPVPERDERPWEDAGFRNQEVAKLKEVVQHYLIYHFR